MKRGDPGDVLELWDGLQFAIMGGSLGMNACPLCDQPGRQGAQHLAWEGWKERVEWHRYDERWQRLVFGTVRYRAWVLLENLEDEER